MLNKKLFILSLIVGFSLALLFIVPRAQAQMSFSVNPESPAVDGVMGNSNASWKFGIDNSNVDSLDAGDRIKITFPAIPQDTGRPFSLIPESLSFSTNPADGLYLSNLIDISGPRNNIVTFSVVSSTVNFKGEFFITLKGVENPVASPNEFGKTYARKWSLEVPGKESFSEDNQITDPINRKGQKIPYDSNFKVSLSDYDAGATADYTLRFTAPTSLKVGEKVTWQFPSEFDISGASITQGADISANTTAQVDGIEKVTTQGRNWVRLIVGNAPTSANDVLTFIVKGIKNPGTKDVYRGFGLFTTDSNNGVIDGMPMEAGGEPGRKGPPLLESLTIGGNNKVNFTVKKELADGTISNLTANEAKLVKVGMQCPDKMFFVGEKYLTASSTVTFDGLLDCNYFAFVMPAQDPGIGKETQAVDNDFKDFFDNYLSPAMIEVPAAGGSTYNITPTFIVPDTYIVGNITGGPANNTNADISAFSKGYASWAPVCKDTNYNYDSMGLDSGGKGYFKIKVKSGKVWKLNLMLHGTGGVIKDASGNEYWAPELGSIYVPDTNTIDIGNKSFVKADKTLIVNLKNSADSSAITNACVSVSRGGMGFMMAPGEPKCNGPYSFKVPQGSLNIEVMQMGMGKPKNVPVVIKAADTTVTKEIIIAAPTSYISGEIKDSDGYPIKNASVFAHSSHGSGEDMTDSNGDYKIYVPAGTYRVEGFAPGFGPIGSKTGITVTESTNPTANFTINLTGFKTISGRVYTDSDASGGYSAGDAVYEGVQIFGYGPAGNNGTATLTDGTYKLRVPAGVYSIEGWSESTGHLDLKTEIDVSTTNQTNKDWKIAGLATLEITIVGAKDISPLFAGAFNPSTGRGNHIDQWQTSGNDKKAKIYLPAGATYEIHVGSPAFGEITPAGSTIAVPKGGATVSYNLPNIATLSGNVGIEGATVWAINTSGPGYFTTLSDSDGDYSIKLPTGKNYDVGVNMTGYLSPIKTITNFSDTTPAQNFTLTESGATISGKVTSDGTTGIAESWVWAEKVGASGWTNSPAQDDGSYSLDIDSGTWKIYANAPCYYKSSGMEATAGSNSANITLTAIPGCVPPQPKVQTIVPATGGTVYNDADGDGNPDIEINFPANSLGTGTDPVTVSIKANPDVNSTLSSCPLAAATQEVTITKSDGSFITTLNSNATLVIHYKDEDLPEGFDESNLQLTRWNATTKDWDPIVAIVDTDNNKITASIDHFSPVGPGLGGVPSAPEELSASASGKTISLSWTSVSNADSYNIYRSSAAGGTYNKIGTSASASYDDSNLNYSTTYYYKVSAVNSKGESTKSSAASATTGSVPTGGGARLEAGVDVVPASISQIKVEAKTDSAVISWATNELSISWLVYGENSDYGEEIKTTDYVTSHSVVLSGLSPGTAYHYKIKSKDKSGNIGSSPDGLFHTLTAEQVLPEVVSFEKPVKEMTVAKLKAKIAQIAALISQLKAKIAEMSGALVYEGIPKGFSFENNLKEGMKSNQVKYLQIILKAEIGEPTYPKEVLATGWFGPITKASMIKFQEKYASEILTSWGLTQGTGFVGKTTRAKLNQLLSSR